MDTIENLKAILVH